MPHAISHSPLTTVPPAAAVDGTPLSPCEFESYAAHGYVIRRSLFAADEMSALAAETERLLAAHSNLIDPQNLRCRFMPHVDTGENLFEVFDPVIDISPVCARLTADERLHTPLETIYGEPARLFKDKLIFKPPGATGYPLHQDIPRAWRGFPRTFLTVLIPIDRPTEENGCTEVFAGYHDAFLAPDDGESYLLPDGLVDESRRVRLTLEPGDVAIFHGLTPHRSAPNRSPRMRRALYLSYNAQSDGGDQRAAHYAEFHQRMRSRLAPDAPQSMYFR